MTILHETSTWNVESTLTRYFTDALADIVRPPQLPGYEIVVNSPETPITASVTPCFSFRNIPAGTRYPFQGNAVGDGKKGGRSLSIFEVSGWTSRKELVNSQLVWAAQLAIMQSMVEVVVTTANNGIQVLDYSGNPNIAVETPYLIRLIELEVVDTAPDPNPSLVRRRMLVSYSWTQRAN